MGKIDYYCIDPALLGPIRERRKQDQKNSRRTWLLIPPGMQEGCIRRREAQMYRFVTGMVWKWLQGDISVQKRDRMSKKMEQAQIGQRSGDGDGDGTWPIIYHLITYSLMVSVRSKQLYRAVDRSAADWQFELKIRT